MGRKVLCVAIFSLSFYKMNSISSLKKVKRRKIFCDVKCVKFKFQCLSIKFYQNTVSCLLIYIMSKVAFLLL